MNTETYFLICSPKSGLVVRRSRQSATLTEPHMVSLHVDKRLWKSYRAGEPVSWAELPPAAQDLWNRRRR